MNREILFRGKRIDNGKWVEGYYMKHINRTPCVINDSVEEKDVEYIIFYDAFSDWNMPRGIEGTHIDPATLGQYTGLTDKTGKRIFEGDVVLKRTYIGKKPFPVTFGGGMFHCGFGVGSSTALHRYSLEDRGIEVIGNIHDNRLEDFDGG